MRKLLLAGIAVTVLVAEPALAADLPRKAPPYAPHPVYNWTGFYVGGNVGYGWGRANGDVNDSDLGTFSGVISAPTSFSNSLNPNGAIAGAQIGYNWQLNPTWVIGLEGDIQWSGQKASRNQSASGSASKFQGVCFDIEHDAGPGNADCDTGPFSETTNVNTSVEAKLQWFSTLRARAGVLVTPTLLLYGTGGFAFGEVKVSGSGTFSAVATCTSDDFECEPEEPASASGSFAFSQSKIRSGWTLGGGVEGALAANWTWKVEYLYLDLGSNSGSVTDNFGNTISWNTKFTDNILRAGLNYRFQ